MASKRVLVVSFGLLGVGSMASAADVTGALTFVGITPCRIIETRAGQGFSGTNGPPALVANANRTFQMTGTVTGLPAQCGIPTTAAAISVTFTATGFTGPGDIRAFPGGGTLPLTSVLNYQLENIANTTTVPLGPSGGGQNGITVRADVSGTDLIADVNGYYVARPLTTLESGRTLTGAWGSGTVATAAAQFQLATFSFPVPLATAPIANFIPVGGPPTAACAGTAAAPTATAGNLCVYEATAANRTFTCIANVSASTSCGTNPFGAAVVVTAVAAGQIFSYGSWAVTAP